MIVGYLKDVTRLARHEQNKLEPSEAVYHEVDDGKCFVSTMWHLLPGLNSWSGFRDELMWPVLWLYRASDEMASLTKGQQLWNGFDLAYGANTLSRDNKTRGTYVSWPEATFRAKKKSLSLSWNKHTRTHFFFKLRIEQTSHPYFRCLCWSTEGAWMPTIKSLLKKSRRVNHSGGKCLTDLL